jgi:hypothetical protein
MDRTSVGPRRLQGPRRLVGDVSYIFLRANQPTNLRGPCSLRGPTLVRSIGLVHQRRTAKAARAAQVSWLVCPEKDIADIESYRPVIDGLAKFE